MTKFKAGDIVYVLFVQGDKIAKVMSNDTEKLILKFNDSSFYLPYYYHSDNIEEIIKIGCKNEI